MMPGMPGMPGMMSSQYPVHPKHRLMATAPQVSPYQPPPEPTKPVIQPLKNLCQYPQGIEGVGSVTVTMDDYKTLAAGTFLNDVIIDFYLKWLQYSTFSQADKDRCCVQIYFVHYFIECYNFLGHIYLQHSGFPV